MLKYLLFLTLFHELLASPIEKLRVTSPSGTFLPSALPSATPTSGPFSTPTVTYSPFPTPSASPSAFIYNLRKQY